MKLKTKEAAVAHTPGPWTTEDATMGPKGDYDVSIMGRDGMTYIGIVTGDDRHGICDQYDAAAEVREAQANARLIAAAPDLLAALESCRYLLESAALKAVDGNAVDERSAAIGKARAAIAKAEAGS